MEEGKFKRIVGASTVTAVLLVVVLVAVMVYQLLAISTEKAKQRELDAKIASYYALIEEKGDCLESRSEAWWIIERARELGYKLPDDIVLNP